MILSPNRSARGAAPVRLVILHTAEGARTAAALGAYFSNTAVQVSSHAGIDDQRIETYVPYDQECWSTRSANPISDNAELCGFAAWTRAQWLTEHHPMLVLTAQWVRDRCHARGIPIRKLSPAQVAAGMAGVCGHVDWTVGMQDGTHTDPGPAFPWDVVMTLAGATPTPPGGDELNDADVRRIADAVLDTPVPRAGDVPNAGKPMTLRGLVAWFDATTTHAPSNDPRALKLAADVAAIKAHLNIT